MSESTGRRSVRPQIRNRRSWRSAQFSTDLDPRRRRRTVRSTALPLDRAVLLCLRKAGRPILQWRQRLWACGRRAVRSSSPIGAPSKLGGQTPALAMLRSRVCPRSVMSTGVRLPEPPVVTMLVLPRQESVAASSAATCKQPARTTSQPFWDRRRRRSPASSRTWIDTRIKRPRLVCHFFASSEPRAPSSRRLWHR